MCRYLNLNLNDTADLQDQVHPSIFVAPEYLTVSSSGPAGEKFRQLMGVFRLTRETHNNKPVWARHAGPDKIFYTTILPGGYWMIGPDPAADAGGVVTADPAGDLWPHQVRSWEYSPWWQSDPLLTVTGNFNINIL